jgi:hypothetical protein
MKAQRISFTSQPTRRLLKESALFALTAALVLSSSNLPTAFATPDNTPPLPSIAAVPADADVSARDVELKSVEEQLLKQLSLGAQPTAQETAGTSLPDIKHVEVNPVVAKPVVPEAPPETKPAAIQTAVAETPSAPPIQQPAVREPRTVSVVPVSQDATPVRRATKKPRATQNATPPKGLEQRVAVAESQVTILSQELENTQRKLADTENRLARAERAASPSGIGAADSTFMTSSYETFTVPTGESVASDESSSTAEKLPVARITKEKTQLRIGPGSNQPSLLTLSRNSIVEIEHRTGTWYRVISPSGARGWVNGSVLLFDVDNFPGSTDRVLAYQPSREPTGIKW